MNKITTANRNNTIFEVKGSKPLLSELRSQGLDLPYGCQYGGCITCAAKLISGKLHQPNATALKTVQKKKGYVLLCVSRPRSDCILEVGVETHDKLYQNPFAKGTALDALSNASQP